MAVIQILQRAALALTALVGLCYFYQTLYLFLPLAKERRPPLPPPVRTGPPRRYAVLIPARNEEAVLPYLLESIRRQDWPGPVGTFVLADNCTDGTAQAARAAGAAVFQRRDSRHVGKGYALDWLLEQMARTGALEQYDVFLVFDADGLLAPDYISRIDKTFAQGYEAVCGYRSSKNFMANWITAGYGLWYVHDCAHLNASRMRLKVTCAVTGTGFGFTRALLERMGGWPFHTLVEDIEFDTWCAVEGVRIGYCPQAVVYDEQPERFGQSWTQRTRWVQGGIQVSLRYAGRLIRGLFRGGARDRWGCFENLTLTLYGYGTCALCGGAASLAALLTGGAAGVLRGTVLSLAGTYLALLGVGTLTMVLERRRIPGSRWRKVRCCATFPLFMMTYLPVALWAVFAPRRWAPIAHTAAVGIDRMTKM